MNPSRLKATATAVGVGRSGRCGRCNINALAHLTSIGEQSQVESIAIMNIFQILWDMPDDPDGNVQHIAEHGLTIEDVEEVLFNPTSEGKSASSGRPCAWGYTLEGIFIIVVQNKSMRT
jgi:uncharacterized DUF497 family protein